MFKKYRFKEFIYEAIAELGFTAPTEIQDKIIPKVLSGQSVIGKSQTGTGKTHAFLFPLINNLGDGPETEVLILTPTRELGFQLYEETVKITKHAPMPIDVRLYVGGTDREREIERLAKSQPKIAIGSIGRISDLAVTANALKIHTIRTVVFDEADMIFESDRLTTVDAILSRIDATAQILVFSATINQELRVFLNKYLAKIPMIDLAGREFTRETITHVFIPAKNRDKDALLSELFSTFHPYLALIFVNTKARADELASHLAATGLEVGKLTGDLSPRDRKQMLRRIKSGQYQYVVATDLAARGIDITGVSHVINYELPTDIDFFTHRVGRTGRAGFTGMSISLYDYDDVEYLQKLRAKGLKCALMDFVNGELVRISSGTFRRRKQLGEELHRIIPMPVKIKPGYRKKRKLEIEKRIRKLRRERIEAIYKGKRKKQ
jgi:ATP-dependent RNA helicase CshB